MLNSESGLSLSVKDSAFFGRLVNKKESQSALRREHDKALRLSRRKKSKLDRSKDTSDIPELGKSSSSESLDATPPLSVSKSKHRSVFSSEAGVPVVSLSDSKSK